MIQSSIFIGRKVQPETRQWLNRQDVQFEEHSMMQIELNKPDLSFFIDLESEKKIFLITSQWAAKWMVNNYSKIKFTRNDFVFCISNKQKAICFQITENVVVAKNRDAGSLVNLVQERIKNEVVIYLKGSISLNIVQSGLGNCQNRFYELEVYKNLPLLNRIEKNFGIYLFFSPSGVSNFQNAGNEIPQSSKIVAIGSTTAESCKKSYVNEVIVSPVQEEIGTIKYATNILKTSPEYSY